jgi:hypothetical protein
MNMKETAEKPHSSLKKRVSALVAGSVAAASIVTASLFGSGAELLFSKSDAPTEDAGGALISLGKRPGETAAASSSPSHSLRAFMLRQNPFVRGLLLLPLWMLGQALIALITQLCAAFSPVGKWLLLFLLNALVFLLIMLFAYHLIFPDKPLKSLFKKRTLLFLAGSALLLTVVDRVLTAYLPQYQLISFLIKAVLALILLSLAGVRLFNKSRLHST